MDFSSAPAANAGARERVLARLAAREGARKRAAFERSRDGESLRNPEESSERFDEAFGEIKSRIEQSLDAGRLDRAAANLADLDALITRCSYFLPAHDRRRSVETADALRDRLARTAPAGACASGAADEGFRACFGLRAQIEALSRQELGGDPQVTKATEPVGGATLELCPSAPSVPSGPPAAKGQRSSIVTTTNSVELSGVDGTTARALPDPALAHVAVSCPDGGSATIRGCRGASIALAGRPAAVYLRDLVDCVVVAGPVAGAVIAHNLSGCHLILACRQCRLTGVRDADAKLRTASAPTLEECSGIRVRELRAADLAAANADVDEAALEAAGLGRAGQAWKKVQDFDWLAEGPSPNWTVVDQAST